MDGTTLDGSLQHVIEALLERSNAFTFASVSTVDGRSASFACNGAVVSEGARVAAIASSILGLSESFSREVRQAGSHWTTISNEQGNIVLIRVPSRQRMHVLAVGADSSQNLATTLHFAVGAADQLAVSIDRETAIRQ